MALGSLFKSLFGKSETTVSDDPFKRNTPAAPAAVAAPPPRREPGVVVHRDEMIDERSRIGGYRYKPVRLGSPTPPAAADAVAALRAENIVNFAQRRLALIPLHARDWREADFRCLIAPFTTFLLAAPADDDAAAWLAVAADIKESGARLAVDGATLDRLPEVAAFASLALLDFSADTMEGFEQKVLGLLARPGLAIAVDGIHSWPEFRMCVARGVRHVLGGFAAVPDEEEKGEKLNQSRIVLIEMLNLLRRDAGVDELSAVAKRDPGIAVKVVAMANSPVSGLTSPVASLEQAMLVLGRETLYRWLSLAMFRSGTASGRDEALLELALCRARFLELVARGHSTQESDELFLVGMLSLLDSLLGMPMAKVLERMNLPAPVVDVLLKSEGPHGRFLMLALAMERGRSDQAVRLAVDLGIAPEVLEDSVAAARAWAEEALLAS